jgi:hypothetical protein
LGFISESPSPSREESESGVTSPEHVARGPSVSSLARGESPRGTKREEGCGPRRAARIKARTDVLVRRSFQVAEVDRRPLPVPYKLLHQS